MAQPAQPDAVTLSSIHRVKGREWSRVVVFGADRGAMPHDLSRDVEEERRVFHVAITRAVDEAVVMADRSRPSRFLAELDGSAPQRPEPTTDAAPPGGRTYSSRRDRSRCRLPRRAPSGEAARLTAAGHVLDTASTQLRVLWI